MKTLSIQIIFCLFLSYTLKGLPAVQDSIKTEHADFIMQQDTIKDKMEINIGWGDDDDEEKSSKSNLLRIGMLDLGISSYVDAERSLDLPEEIDILDQVLWRSINVGLHVVNVKAGFGSDDGPQKVGLSTGLKVSWNHYSMQQDYNLLRNAADFESALDFNVPELKKNRLRATYLQIPVLLEFNSRPNRQSKSINIGVGYVHQFLLGSQYKYKTTEGEKLKTRGDFNLRKSMGMIEGRLGIGNLNFYAQYGLSELFQDDGGPAVTPVTFGVNIIPR